ncbi:MAG: cache domain-containing protein [Candidatus Magasanikbacteria bacterium]|nr:cache domain-containing protein [Candidatus Magasanikbacteria bacterium]
MFTIGGAGIFYTLVMDYIEGKTFEQLSFGAHVKNEHIQTFFSLVRGRMGDQAADAKIVSCLLDETSKNEDCASGALSTYLRREKIATFSLAEELYVLSTDGQMIAGTVVGSLGGDFADTKLFENGIKNTYIHTISETQFDADIALFASTPIYSNNEVVGVLVGKLKEQELFDILEERKGWGVTGETYLVNSSLLMISPSRFQPDQLTILSQESATKNAKDCFSKRNNFEQQHSKLQTFLGYRGVPVVGVHSYVASMDWCLLAEYNKDEISQQAQFLISQLLLVALLIIFFFGGVSYVVGTLLGKDLRQIIHTGKNILSGGTHPVSDNDNEHEIEGLGNLLDSFTEALFQARVNIDAKVEQQTKTLVEERKKTQKALKEAELLNDTMIERELRMIQLKKENQDLKIKKKSSVKRKKDDKKT